MADALGLSVHTCDHYVRELRAIHGVQTTTALVCAVWRERYAELERRHDRCCAALAVLDRRQRDD